MPYLYWPKRYIFTSHHALSPWEKLLHKLGIHCDRDDEEQWLDNATGLYGSPAVG